MASTAVAQSGGHGNTGAPTTKKQCLRILKHDQREAAAERKSFPARKKKADAKVKDRRAKYDALEAKRARIQRKIDALDNTNVDAFTQDALDALTAQLDALVKRERAMGPKVDKAQGKVYDAVSARRTMVKKYKTDKKNWPKIIKQVKTYCSGM